MSKTPLLLGPVVGKVTDRTARILLEVVADQVVPATLVDLDGATTLKLEVRLKAGVPGVCRLEGLRPASRYECRFDLGAQARPRIVSARFHTVPSQPTLLRLGVVSCNFPTRRESTNAWQVLYDRYVDGGDLDLLLHIGDQVYGDDTFADCIAELRRQGKLGAALREQILARYRRLYRLNWAYDPATAAVLRSVPNLMIWDDHEIVDDWGSRSEHKDPKSPEFQVGLLARQVFRDYQRRLWDDKAFHALPVKSLDYHHHAFGDAALLFVDQRGGRSFASDPHRPYLSRLQWKFLEQYFHPDGPLKGKRVLLVVTSVPLCYFGYFAQDHGEAVYDDLKDHWAWADHRREQIAFLRHLRQWKEAQPNREVLVIGGDVHLSMKSEIFHHDRPVFRQLITSPVTNKPPGMLVFSLLRRFLSGKIKLDDSYSFQHAEVNNRRTFGIVRVEMPVVDATVVKSSLVQVLVQ